jgi:hypothetical protein
MTLDAAYQAKYLQIARMLWDAAEGNPGGIPDSYAAHLEHRYSDGDVSMVSLINRFDNVEDLEDYELDEALEMLGKVSPDDWPFLTDIVSVDAAALLQIYDEGTTENFAEPAPEESIEQVLTHAIESVFGDKVQKVRAKGGKFFNKDNQYGQREDASFEGEFQFDGTKFDFEIVPDEQGWSVQYRMTAESFDSLPPIPREEADKHDGDRKVRNRRWG